MAVNVTNVVVLDNPAPATNPFQFEVTFECLAPLEEDLEWKVIYVGNAEDASADQVLEEVMVGPVPEGVNRFLLQTTSSPDYNRIRTEDLIGATIVLVTCSYRDHEFVRVGYYVVNELDPPLQEGEALPARIDMSKVHRNILADRPRITRFPINWASGSNGELDYEMEEQEDENAYVDNMADRTYAFSTQDEDVEEDDEEEDDDKDLMSEEDIADSDANDLEDDMQDAGAPVGSVVVNGQQALTQVN
mmetsp:Transcript_11115/g.41524  ORF Transcript_11115/g.41524 Transcript_11115/m.41524 type:complete len:247 (+) Transcript_11115:60-800(+)